MSQTLSRRSSKSKKPTSSKNSSTKKKNQKSKSKKKATPTRAAKKATKMSGKTKSAKTTKPVKKTAKKSPAKAKVPAKSKVKAKFVTRPKTITRRASKAPATRDRSNSRKGTTRGTVVKMTAMEQKRAEQVRIDSIWKMFKKTGDENLRNILAEYHFPLVRYIAERLLQTLPKSIELDDLVSAGTFGLLDAIRGFDLKRGIKFKTYCSTRIRGSILDELRSQDWVPRLVRLKAHRLDKALRRLEARNGREVNDYELAREMGLSMQELADLKSEANPKTIFSLSEKLDDSDDNRDMEKVEIIEDKKGTDPVQALQQQDVLEVITSNLTKKERLIIIMYYYEGLTMREIGDIMSLTESRVCQIHSNVMSRLKNQLKSLAVEGATI